MGLIPSIAIGGVAFGAGELILHTKDVTQEKNKTLQETLKDAKQKNTQIANMISKVEDQNLKNQIKEINVTVAKIIETIQSKPEKAKKMNSFFEYYLPVTLKILTKYDEIENQRLVSYDSKKFMTQTQNMVEKINSAFKNQLNSLYQTEIVDTDAEMKVFEAMLKADGYSVDTDFDIKKEDK